MLRVYRFMLCVAALLVAAGTSAYAGTYRITDLGSFGQDLWITGMNVRGQVVGSAGSCGPFVWNPGAGVVPLQILPGCSTSVPQAINDRGQIVGYGDYSHACLWEDGKSIADLGALMSGEFSPGSRAADINEHGQVVGASTGSLGYNHACLWDVPGAPEDITAVGESVNADACAINDDGVVVGRHGNRAFIWSRSTGMHDMENVGSGANSAVDVSNSGRVLVDAYSAAAYNEAFVWDEGIGARNLGALPTDLSYSWTTPSDMNNPGQVVGTSNWQPFVWDDTLGMQPLPVLPGHPAVYASCINDLGLIAGYSIDPTGDRHFILWEPVPEPSSLAALSAGLVMLGAFARTRRPR